MISAKEARTLSDYANEKLTEEALKYTEDKIKESAEQGRYSCVIGYDMGTNTKQIKELLEEQGYDVGKKQKYEVGTASIYLFPTLSISWE